MIREFALGLTIWLTGCNPTPVASKNIEVKFDQYKRADSIVGGHSFLDGATGVLGYEGDCLYLEERGGRTGLVLPSNARFDGRNLVYRQATYTVGKRYSIGGYILDNSSSRRFNCRTSSVLVANSAIP